MRKSTLQIGLLLSISLITTANSQTILSDKQAAKGVQYLEERKGLLEENKVLKSRENELLGAIARFRTAVKEKDSAYASEKNASKAWQQSAETAEKIADNNYKAFEKAERKNNLLTYGILGVIALEIARFVVTALK